MALMWLCAEREVAPGQVAEVEVNGAKVALSNVWGRFYAVSGVCPHRGGPLAQGALHGETIVCPWHAWEFNCRTGECEFDASLKIQTYAVVQSEGSVHLNIL